MCITFLVWSALLFVYLLFTFKPLERLEGTREYLTYNFGSTLYWVLECGLTFAERDLELHFLQSAFDKMRAMKKPSDIMHCFETWTMENVEVSVELALAIFFLLDSMNTFNEWYRPDKDVSAELLNTFIDLAAYLYLWIKLKRPGGGDIDDDSNGYASIEEVNMAV